MRKILRTVLVVALSLGIFINTPVAAAERTEPSGGGAAVTHQGKDQGYSVELYDGTNGLPTSDANTVLSSSDGFVWIGGYSGLIRYDGTSFERITEPDFITSVNTLFEDSSGRIWAGTNDNGIVAFKNDKYWHYTYKDGLSSSSIRSIVEDENKNIIVGTSKGLYYIDPEMGFHKLDNPMLNTDYVMELVVAEDDSIYGITWSGAIFRIKDLSVNSSVNSEEIGLGTVSAIYPIPGEPGKVYLGTVSGDMATGSFDDSFATLKRMNARYLVNRNINDESNERKPINSITYASGRVWVLYDDVVGWMDKSAGFHALTNLPMDSAITTMEEDYEGNLWFTSTRQGVMKIVSNKFTNITDHSALSQSVVNATCLHNGYLYIGTDNGLQILNKNSESVSDELTKTIGNSRIRCLLEDTKGNLWISCYNNDIGLICYSADKGISYFNKNNGMPSNEIRMTCETEDGSILVATNGGIALIKDKEIERTIGESTGMTGYVLTAGEFEGKIYAGTDGDGMYEVDGNSLVHLGREEGLTSDVILRVKRDDIRNVLWIITSNSIQYLKDGKINTVKGFPYSNNYDIYFDSGENAWILASNGIYVVKAQDMIDKEEYEYLLYDYSKGMPSMPTVNAYSALAAEGTLYVAAREGVFSVNINNYFDLEHEIKLSVPYIEADGVRYYVEEGKIDLPSSADEITIYGYALTYSMQNPKLKYYFEGVDKKANIVLKDEMKPVRYTNIAGGQYVYRLSVINSSTGELQQTMSITINKEKAIYEQLWFSILVIILTVLVIGGIIAVIAFTRIKKYKAKQERDKKLISEIVRAFARTIDMKDKYTNGHSARVAKYTAMLARELGYDEETVNNYFNIALLHDIGKIGVPAEVLNKPGKLTDEEFATIKSHTTLGRDALKDISIMPDLAIGAGSHHERPDGRGYPDGLKGDEIPRVAQIIAVADTFDAMYSDRPYRKRMNFEKAVSIIKEASGTQLTEDVVDAFLRLVEQGKFRAPDDMGGGSTEDINNIHKKYEEEAEK